MSELHRGMPLYWGEYSDKNLWIPRSYFAAAVQIYAPEVMKDFYQNVWLPEYGDLEETITAWAKRYHIDPQWWTINPKWVIETAAYTWDHWNEHEDMREQRIWTFFDAQEYDLNVAGPPDPPQYQPIKETRENYRSRVKRYMDEVEAKISATHAKAFSGKKSLKHFEWLVRYQVQGSTCNEIVYHYTYQSGQSTNVEEPDAVPEEEITEANVSKALHRTSQTIGLKLRPQSKGGRPTKKG